jgi:hypothetical protein
MRHLLISIVTFSLALGCADKTDDESSDNNEWSDDESSNDEWGDDELGGGGPQTSYCEALCDWATECADGVSALSISEMQERCEIATNNADGDCTAAESGDLGPDDILILNECTSAVDSMSCSGVIGSQTDVLTGRPPEITCMAAYGGESSVSGIDWTDPSTFIDIGTYKTYNAARNAVLATGPEFCDEISTEICTSLIRCAPDFEDSEEYTANAITACLDIVNGFTGRCKTEGLYDQSLPISYNPARFFAQKCSQDLADSPNLCSPSEWAGLANCAGAFINPMVGTDLTGTALDAFAGYLN